jgi:hypothetical protein
MFGNRKNALVEGQYRAARFLRRHFLIGVPKLPPGFAPDDLFHLPDIVGHAAPSPAHLTPAEADLIRLSADRGGDRDRDLLACADRVRFHAACDAMSATLAAVESTAGRIRSGRGLPIERPLTDA